MLNSTDPSVKKNTAARDWTQGGIIPNLLLISWPMMVLGALYSVNLILEMIWVGKLGAASIAGVGVAGFVVLLVVSIKSGLSSGERAMVARLVGQKDVAAANRVAGQAYLVALVYGAVITLIGLFLVKPVFGLFALQSEAINEGVSYLHIVLTGWLTEAIWITSFSVMQASGDAISPLKIAIVIRIVNALLCPFLVLGIWIFPQLGVKGAAITYITATGLGMCICLWVLLTGRTRLHLRMKDFRPDPPLIWRMMKIGIPGALSTAGKTFADLVLTWLMIPFGTAALAAHNVLSRIESFINTPGNGLGTGSSVMVGQNLGAGQPKRAARSGWLATGLAASIMALCAITLLVWAENIVRIFNPDPDLVKTGVYFLRIAAVGYLGMSIVNILQSSISGAGDTLPSMIIALSMLWIVQIPLALVLSRETSLQIYGVRWAIVSSLWVGATAYLIYFWSGRWKRKKI
jgi:putative MATE family efflux protein